jgi:HD-GYP domain-containing protein (c-di-GMP phosphodiesterase class II)
MTTDRPYRKRLSLDVVIAELQNCKGTQFDPELIDVAVASVAVRRLIEGASGSQAERHNGSPNSRRVNWPSSGLWRRRA